MKQILLVGVVLLFSHFLLAQSQTTLLTIDGTPVSEEEFLRVYTKNNQKPEFDTASVNEYMNLFVNYKLKVLEAQNLGYDTAPAFKQEFKGYVKQLEKPYFTDADTDEALIKEAYERMKWSVNASHILINCDAAALPVDTLKAYNEISSIRRKALKGEDFEQLARTYSQDPSVKTNGGSLGYFSVFSMVYPFETAAYNTPVAEVSKIIRTRFGYHILKVNDKKANEGEVKVAHIMFGVRQGATMQTISDKQKQAQQVYNMLVEGADFAKMALRFSDDGGTKEKGGELPYFGSGRMIPEFEKVAFSLENPGDIAEPVRTNYGYHIIKLIDKKPLGTYEELKPSIKGKISKDVRAGVAKTKVIADLHKEYKTVKYKKNMEPLVAQMDSNIYKGMWDAGKLLNAEESIFVIADTLVFTLGDFAGSLNKDGRAHENINYKMLVDKLFNKWCDQLIVNYESSQLTHKYPEFKYLVKEYFDGILLFNITDDVVWSKAMSDTVGLKAYYEQVKTNYMWEQRVSVTTFAYNNSQWTKKILKLAKKSSKADVDLDATVALFLEKAHKKDSTLTLEANTMKLLKGDNELIDRIGWNPATYHIATTDSLSTLHWINNIVQPEPKELSEIRGLIMAEYQNYLEQQWITGLRKKYKVEINKEAVEALSKYASKN